MAESQAKMVVVQAEVEIAKSEAKTARVEAEMALLKGQEKERFEIAKTMIADSLPLEMISKYSGLSVVQIKELSSEDN